MSFDRPEDNKRFKMIKADPDEPYTLIRLPAVYFSFDLLKGGVLKEAEGRRLVVEKDGEQHEYWLDGSMDVAYLTRKEFADPDVTASMRTGNGRNPFELILGKTIDWVDMYTDRVYNRQMLAVHTFVGSYSCPLPLEVFLYYDKGAVMLDATVSERLINKFAGEIMGKDPDSWSDEDVSSMAVMKPLWSMQALKKVDIFLPHSEQEFAEQYPDAYRRVLDAEEKMKESNAKPERVKKKQR